MRGRLKKKLTQRPQYPDVTGDRKILRFLRGHEYDVDKVCDLYEKFLKWRDENGVDEIRRKIVLGERDHPLKFPRGDFILSKVPQIVISPHILDRQKAPISVETFNFRPSELMEKVTMPEYITFLIHCLEYKSLILEQLSEEREQEYLTSLSEADRKLALSEGHATDGNDVEPCGVLMSLTIIRDLKGLGFDHVGQKGQEVVKAVIGLATVNYPGEYILCPH